MEMVVKGKYKGKTYDLILMAAKKNATIVSISQAEANRVAEEAKEMKLDIPAPASIFSLLQGEVQFGTKCFIFDNADHMLEIIARGIPVLAFSVNEEKQK